MSNAKSKSATPWTVEKRMTYDLMNDREGYTLQINSSDGSPVALLGNGKEEKAELIVRAVNAHEELLLALEDVKRYLVKLGRQDSRSYVEQITEAIAKAEDSQTHGGK